MLLLAQQDSGTLIRFTLEPLAEDYGIPLAVMGILVVFVALTLVVVLINVLPKIIERLFPGQVATTVVPQPADLELAASDELPEETLVVIAAAVAETIRRPHRIIRIRGLTPEDLGWSLEGRMQHHQSHRVKQRSHR